jgi:hypothetical protein
MEGGGWWRLSGLAVKWGLVLAGWGFAQVWRFRSNREEKRR